MDTLVNAIYSLLAMLVTLGILVTIHEYGHFSIARWCGVRVERFSIGFGKPLVRWLGKTPKNAPADAQPTEYVIGALPLGGYVKMLGEQEEEIAPAQRAQAFNFKPLPQRAAIVAAGPVANFLLAIGLYWFMFMSGVTGLAPVVGDVSPDSAAANTPLRSGDEIVAVDGNAVSTWQDVRLYMLDRLGENGTLDLRVRQHDSSVTRDVRIPITHWLSDTDEPDLLGSLGITPYHLVLPPRIDAVTPDSRAQAAGIEAGDLIVSSNGEPVRTWSRWLDIVRGSPETTLNIVVQRNGKDLPLELTPAVRTGDDGKPTLDDKGAQQGFIGASVKIPQLPAWMNRTVSYNPVTAVPKALAETWDNSVFVLDSIKKMLFGMISVKNLSGPITIAQVAGETASSGLEYYVSFLALLSISLGVLNLLPIPVLDGGHLFYYAIEAVIRRPVPRRVQELGMQLGMMVVTCIMILALFNDVNRLF